MEKRLNEIFENYDTFSDEEEEKVYKEIIGFAENNFEEFKTFLQKQKQEDYGILIDALSLETKKWSNLFFDEIKRIFTDAEKATNPAEAIMFLDEFVFIEPNDFSHSKELVNFVQPYLKHKLPVFRYWALSLLTDFMDKADTLMINLIEQHLKDKDWRIRYWAYTYLTELRGKGKYKLSFFDKMKAKINAPYKFV